MADSMSALADRLQAIHESLLEQENSQAPAPAFSFEPSPQAAPYMDMVRSAEEKYGIPQNLLARIIDQESGYNPQAVSSKGARGIAQIMPEYHPGAEPDDPAKAIDYAASYLRQNADRFGGDWEKAVAAYNAGPGTVEKQGMDNLPPETQDYKRRIMGQPAEGEPVDYMALADRLEAIHKRLSAPAPGFFESVGGDIAGGLVDLAEMYGRAGRALPGGEAAGADQGGIMSKAIKWAEDFRAAHPSLEHDPRRKGFSRWFHEGLRSAVTSLATGLPGLAAGGLLGSTFGPAGTFAGGVVGYALSGATTFGLSQYDETLELGLKAGKSREEIEPGALRSGFYEWGFEFGADLLEGWLLGGKVLTAVGKQALKEGVGSLIKHSVKQMLDPKRLIKHGLGFAAIETSSEMLTAGLEVEELYRMGLTDQRFLDGAIEAFGPSLVASMIFFPLGEYYHLRIADKIKTYLKNPDIKPKDRMDAVGEVHRAIAEVNKPVADAWADAATRAVAAGEPIDLDAPIATDAQLDARIAADEDLADQAAQAAAAEYSRPVEQDVADHETSKAADPLGDDALAQDIIDKVAFGQPTRVAPVATTPRGEGAEELLASMAEATAPAPPAEEQLFHDQRSGKVLRVAESGGQFGIFKTDTPDTHKGKHVKGTEWYASREEAEAALATYADERQFTPTTAQQFTQEMADQARQKAEAQRRIPEELQPVADQSWRYVNSTQFDEAIEDGTITAATGIAKEDIRRMIAEVGKSAEGFKGSAGLYSAATGVNQLYDLTDEQLTQQSEQIPEELMTQIRETKAKQAGIAPAPARPNIPAGGSRQSAIEYSYYLAYEAAKEYPGVAHKDLVALQVYDKPGQGNQMIDVRFATRENVDEVHAQIKQQYPDGWITSSYDLTPYRPKKGEIQYQEYAAQRDQGIESPGMMKAEAEPTAAPSTQVETPSTPVETPGQPASDYETLWDDIRKDTRNGSFILKKAGFGAPHGWLNEAGVQALKNNLSSLTPANQEKIRQAIDTWWKRPEAPATEPAAPAQPAAATAPAAGDEAANTTWWDKELTPAGRRQAMEKAGIKLPDKVLWANIKDEHKQKLLQFKQEAPPPAGLHANQVTAADLYKLTSDKKGVLANHGVQLYDKLADARKAIEAVGPRGADESIGQYLGKLRNYQKQARAEVRVADIRLKGDYGVEHIDAYSDAGEKAKNALKNDARRYLLSVNQALNYAPDVTKQSKVGVTYNAGGIGVGGDTHGIFWKPGSDYGAYVQIGHAVVPGAESSPSGVSIMWRVTTKEQKYAGRENKWEDWNISAADLAKKMRAEVDRVEAADKAKAAPEATAGGAQMGTVAPAAKEGRPYEQIADFVRQRLKNRESTPSTLLLREASKAFGGSLAQGTFSIKQVYDAMELGVNQYILHDLEPQNQTPQQVIEHLKSLLADLPTQTRRTQEADELQQFSTPPPLAYMANWVANIRRDDQYLEPSAGVGGLAVFGKKFGADPIVVNELAEYRKKLLMSLPFDSFISEDGAQIGNMRNAPHMKNIRPDVVVMNPPFSSTSGRIPGKRNTMEGARHVEQALKILKDGGRLVAITGRGMAMDRPTFKDWWKKIREQYNVRANVGVSGQEYAKYGTTFDNQLIVIDKTGPTTKDVVIGSVAKTEDLIPILQEVRDDRAPTSQPHAAEPAGQKEPGQTQGGLQPRPGVRPAAGPVGLGQQPNRPALAGRPAAGLAGNVPVSGGPGIGRPVSGERPQRPVGGGPEGEPGGAGGGDLGAAARPAGGNQGQLSLEEKEIEARKEEISENLYEGYKPERLNVPGAQPHPTPLVQSAAMAAVQPPKPTYKPHLPDRVIKGNAKKQGISDIQIEAVVYAGQAHDRKLADGSRMGYFIGDGTGVGKGREIAAIILDNWNQGRKKAVWLSEKASLLKDARRDMENILWNPKLVFPHSKTKSGAPIGAEQGILFSTYDTLKQPEKEGKIRRLDQVVNWLGKDFDGVIAMDEAHNMGNCLETQGERGKKKPSQRALAGVELQRLLPNARIVYVSATGATEVMNLAYASRLGLWGEGTPFANNQRFVNDITAGGIAAMEMVAQDLKAQGKYAARSLSYDGVAYDRIVHALTKDQVGQYDTMVEAWKIVLQNIGQAMEESGAAQDSRAKTQVMNAFWGAQLRFFNILLTGLQLPSMIASAKNDLANGKSVVIQMTSTGESAMDRAMSAADEEPDLDNMDLSPIEGLMEYVQNSFPVAQYEEIMDPDGNIIRQVVKDSAGNIVQNPEAVALREALLDRLGALRGEIPGNPLDSLLEVFGPQITAEVTGRKRRLVTNDEGKRVIEKRSKAKGEADADAFMAGKKRVLIFSEAGGTGRSYHADLASENQEKRSHYLLQAGWRADRAVQGLGRTHRSNQASPPEYWLVTTNLEGQKRFISTIARRLDQLGALTRGSRETGSQGIFGLKDNLEADHVHDALRQFIVDVYVNEVPGLTIQELAEQTGLHLVDQKGNLLNTPVKITQFLNRILCLPVAQQNKVFGAFNERIENVFNERLNAGTLDVGLETLRAQSIKKFSEEEVYQDKETGAATRYIQLDVSQPNKRRLAWEDGPETKEQFIQNKRSGQVWAIERVNKVDPESGDRRKDYHLLGPNSARQNIKEADGDAKMASGAWTELTRDQARGLWQAQYDQLPETINYKEHIVTGLLLPIWDRLIGHPQLLRIQTDAGERFIGRRIDERFLAQTLENLGASAAKIDMSPAEVHTNVLHNNYDVRLANGWEIKRSKVSGENRIELRNISWSDYQLFEKYGLFHERINWQTRYFIPTGTEQGTAAIEALMVNRPIVKASPPTAVRYGMEAGGGEVEEQPRGAGYGVSPLQGPGPGVPLDQGQRIPRQLPLFGYDQYEEVKPTAANQLTFKKTRKVSPHGGLQVTLARTGSLRARSERVINGADAAALLVHLTKDPQENVYFISTDSTGRVLEIHRSSRGVKNRSLVSAIEGIGHLLDQPQVARVFFAHNHPGAVLAEKTGRQVLNPSNDDRAVVNRLHEVLALADIDLTSVVIGGNEFVQFGEFAPEDTPARSISATVKTVKPVRLPVRERRQKVTGPGTGTAINFPATAIQVLKQYGDRDGVLFVNGQSVDVDFMPWPAGYSHREAAKLIIARAARNNASAIILNFKEADPAWMVPGNSRYDFIANFKNTLSGDLQVLDIILNDQSMLEAGREIPRGATWSLNTERTLLALGTDVQRRALDAQQVRNVRQVADLVTEALAKAGVSKELRNRIALEFKPIIDLRGKDVEQTVTQWAEQGQTVNTILGATTFRGLNALVELSLEQDLTTMERTAFHEGFHVLANWVLPEAEYAKLMKSFNGNEEASANAFADFVAGRGKPIGWARRIFIKLRDLLRRVGNALRGAGFTIPEDIFGKLAERGYAGQRPGTAGRTTIALMGEERAAKWYSQMEQHLTAKLPGSGTPQQFKQTLEAWAKKGQIKAEELEWSGLGEWLDDFQKMKEAEWVEQRKQSPEIKKELGENYMDFLLGRHETAKAGIQSYDRIINRLKNEAKKQKFSVDKGELLAELAANRVRIEEVLKGEEPAYDYYWHESGWIDDDEYRLAIPDAPTVRWVLEDQPDGSVEVNRYEEDDGLTYEDMIFRADDRDQAREFVEEQVQEESPELEANRAPGTKHAKWQLPGGENYRELLLTLPTAEGAKSQAEEIADELLRGPAATPKPSAVYRSGHWEEPNVLAHVRFNERTGPDGERILFLEEIQSDWHQAGRKKGYQKPRKPVDTTGWQIEVLDDNRYTGQRHVRVYDQNGNVVGQRSGTRATDEEILADYAQHRADLGHEGEVPDVPFKKTWPLLAIKRMVRYAAEHGFDAIAWTPGEVQAERYDLSKQVDRIASTRKRDGTYRIEVFQKDTTNAIIDHNYPKDKLEEVVGKELAQKIIEAPGGLNEWKGLDLKVGGEGMKGFYDQILPAAVNKFFGKAAWGKAKAQQMPLERNQGQIDLVKKLRQPEQFEKEQQPTVWAMRITPQMRAKALAEGMSLFQVADTTDVFGQVLPGPVAEQMKAARGRTRDNVKQRVGAWIKTAIATFTPGQMFPQMPNKYFGKENEILRRFVEISSYSKARAVMDLKEILNPKKLGPAGYDLFNLKIVLDDMLYDVETEGRPLNNWQERYGELPFGFQNADQLRESLARIDERVAANPDVAAALQRRRKIMRDLRQDLVREKLLPRSVLDDERYFHHEVLQFANAQAMAGMGTGSRDVRTKKKGWQIYRTGSIKDYNTEYMQSEFKVLAQGYSQLETKRILDELDRSSNIIGELRHQARHTNYVAVVGGPENYRRLEELRNQVAYLRGEGGYLDSETRAQIKALSDEIWELDPTMPFRQKIAMGMRKLAATDAPPGSRYDQYVDLDDMDFSDIARMADAGDPNALTVLKAVNERKAFIAETLGDAHLTWQKLMEEREPREGSRGWAEWIPKPGSAWYLTNSLSDKLLEQIGAGIPLSEEDIRKVWTRGADKRWVVPAELAEVLNGKEFLTLKQDNVVAAAAENTLNWWKRWILINPFRIFKYNFNNLSGDFDITLAYDPRILKWTKQAAKDLWVWHYDKSMLPATKTEMTKALKHGVIGSGMTVHDIPDITDSAQFDQLVSSLRADKRKGIDYIKRFWEGSKNFTTWRENVLRLAAYRYFQEQLRAGKRVYGASDQAKVDATTDLDKKAALLSRELVGDYGGLSKGGQWLRRKMIPFYSWMEINAPRYWRMFKNLPVEGEPGGRRLRMGGVLAKKAGISLSKMALFYAMVQMFNHLVWPEEEEELGEVGRRQLHLILGRRSDGSIMSVRMQGALSDALSWTGSEDIPQDLADVRSGKKKWWQLLTEVPVAVANRFVQGIRPDIKGPAELISGRQVFPDVTQPRPIRDRYEHLARMFSLDPIYRHLAGRPVKEGSVAGRVLEDLGATIAFRHDPGEVAFHQAKTLVVEYLADNNIERPATDPTNRSNALYYYRKAIQLGDSQAALHYLQRYKELGGTPAGVKISIKRQHPLSGLPAKYRLRFMASLSPEDREVVRRGIQWYRKVYH